MRIGELFSGYGGLGMGVQSVLGGDVVWHSDIDKGACKILAHRYPDVPNLGDITTVDWSSVEPVDVLTGGSPCQDVSNAGRRRGMTEGTRSNLWVAMREAIAELRPSLVVWENVKGAYSAEAASEVVPGGRLLGPRDGGPALRALGRVLGDLSALGYDCRWHGIRAADIGAPHGRLRVFVVAQDAHRVGERDGTTAPLLGLGTGASLRPHGPDCGAGAATDSGRQRYGSGVHPRDLGSVDGEDARGAWQREWSREVTEHRGAETFGIYDPAVRRWERVLGRCAPPATELVGDRRVLSPRFEEWMMGLPNGWVVDTPNLTHAEARRALGNGVVPQQCAAALRIMLGQAVAA